MSNIIIDMTSALALVDFVVNNPDEGLVYADYIEENAVTLENVSKHVAALLKITWANGTKGLTDNEKAARKSAYNKYNNGFRYNLGQSSKIKGKSDKYVTAEGLKAGSWDDFVAKARAEWNAANDGK